MLVGVLRRFHVDAPRWAGACAERATDALFQAAVVALKGVSPASSWVLLALDLWIHHRDFLMLQAASGDPESGEDRLGDVFEKADGGRN